MKKETTDLSAIKTGGRGRSRRITADYVADALREAIQSGRLPDGAVLSQAAIAARMGVSRVPVREAMRQLAAEGLIQSRAHHVALVRGLSLKRIAELYEYRALLEGFMTRRSVPRLTEPEVKKIKAKNAQMKGTADHAEWLRLNGQFHSLILDGSADETGQELVGQLRSQAERYVRMWGEGEGVHRPDEVAEEHERIIRAISSGDADAAGTAVEEHIRHTGEHLIAHGEAVERELEEQVEREPGEPGPGNT